MSKVGRQKKQRLNLHISVRPRFPFHYRVLWFTLLAVESFDLVAILGFYFVGVAPITRDHLVRQLIPVIATLIATFLFTLSHSLLWRSIVTLSTFLTATLVKQAIAYDLSIIATAWYFVLGGAAAGFIFLDNFGFLERAIRQIRQLNNPEIRNFAINFCFEECKAYLDKAFTAATALASALAAAMAILWGAPDQVLPVSRGERLVSAINMIVGFGFLGLELLIWGFKPLWNHIASLRELAITSVDRISEK
jgi:signal transduction histidine kinase